MKIRDRWALVRSGRVLLTSYDHKIAYNNILNTNPGLRVFKFLEVETGGHVIFFQIAPNTIHGNGASLFSALAERASECPWLGSRFVGRCVDGGG